MSGDRLETVAVVYSQSDLALLLSMFEDRGIWVTTVGSGHAAIEWSLALALGGTLLRVHEEELDAARDLLAGIRFENERRGAYANNPYVDLLVALFMMALAFVPPPARIPPALASLSRGDRRC